MRKPRPRSATPSVICQLGIARMRDATVTRRSRRPPRRRATTQPEPTTRADDRGRGPRTGAAACRRPRSRSARAPPSGAADRRAGRRRRGRRDAAPVAPDGAASSPTGAGPAGAGCGPYSLGAVAPRSSSQPAWNAGHVEAERRRERLVVGPPVRVRADERDERVLAVRRGPCSRPPTRSRRRPGKQVVVGRELAAQAVERDQVVPSSTASATAASVARRRSPRVR